MKSIRANRAGYHTPARLLLSGCLAIGGLIGAGASARASTILQTQTVALTKTTQMGLPPVPLGAFSFDKFDDQGGLLVLDSVSLIFQGELRNDGNLSFITPNTTIDFTFNSTSVRIEQLPGGLTLAAPVSLSYHRSLSTSPTEVVSPGNPKLIPLALTDNIAYAPNASNTNPLVFTSPSDLAFFTGTGTFQFPLFASALSSFASSTGNDRMSVNTLAGGTVSLTYNNSPGELPGPLPMVPEPSTGWLFGLGSVLLVGLVCRSRGRGGMTSVCSPSAQTQQ